MPQVIWNNGSVLLVAPERSFAGICKLVRREAPDWVVLRQASASGGEWTYFVFTCDEILRHDIVGFDREHSRGSEILIAGATPSIVEIPGEAIPIPESHDGPCLHRVVSLERDGSPKRVGEVLCGTAGIAWSSGARPGSWGPKGWTQPTNIVQPEASENIPRSVETDAPVLLSAEAPPFVELSRRSLIQFRVAIAPDAAPLSLVRETLLREGEPITVILTINGSAIEAVDDRVKEVPTPEPGTSTEGHFVIKGNAPGVSDVAVMVQQADIELGGFRFAVEVPHATTGVTREQTWLWSSKQAAADRLRRRGDGQLVLTVQERQTGEGVRYDYILHSRSLGLHHVQRRSRPFGVTRGGGIAPFDFIADIYNQIIEVVQDGGELARCNRRMTALGSELCRQLFDPEVTEQIWKHKDSLTAIEIVSDEGRIPWELLRLRDPVSQVHDKRFLGEYGLVRSIPGHAGAVELALRNWAYLIADFPNKLETPVGVEREYFKVDLLQRGVNVREVLPQYDAFYSAIESDDTDVLHIAAHGHVSGQLLLQTKLIIGEETRPGRQPSLVEIDMLTVTSTSQFRTRRPIIFLNACETSRQGAGLTHWNSVPKALMEAGAGAVIGSGWPVNDKPAAQFAKTFYNMLLDGGSLAEAAKAARAAIREFGDSSWLAFTVYGEADAKRRTVADDLNVDVNAD